MFSAMASALQSIWQEMTTDLHQLQSSTTVPASSSTSAPAAVSGSIPGGDILSSPRHSLITHEFLPTALDVRHTCLLLVRGLGLPIEIAWLIVDAARYWPAVTGTNNAVGTIPLRLVGTRGLGGSAEWGRRTASANAGGGGVLRASDTRQNKSAQLVAVSAALPDECTWTESRKVKVRCVKWSVRSRDQGWVSDGVERRGTYNGSYSWFDACILRPVPPTTSHPLPPPLPPAAAARMAQIVSRLDPATPCAELFPTFLVGNLLSTEPDDSRQLLRCFGWDLVERAERVEDDGNVREHSGALWRVQANVVASTEYHVHDGEWQRGNEHVVSAESLDSSGGGDGLGFVDKLRPGDRVGIWARAMFPGWVNDVDDVKIEIRYSV